MIWYVKNNTTGNGNDGDFANPFDTLVEAENASAIGHTIFVYYGDGTDTGQNVGITLKDDQKFIGQGVDLSGLSRIIVGKSTHPVITDNSLGHDCTWG